jgi:radical SAM family RiPP maturation amino acid epimerase
VTASTQPQIMSLLGDLSNVPADHIRDVAHTKRLLERWTMDPRFQDAFADDPIAAIASLGLQLTPEQVTPLIDADEAIELNSALAAGKADHYPLSVLRYRAFCSEKRIHRGESRRRGESSDKRLAAWRQRQINRCLGELGAGRADAIVHGPGAFELSTGCTVGCWFCGVAAPKFDHWLPYTPENAELWRGALTVTKEVVGTSIQEAFLYWATDPLDNPDYEKFLVDFHAILGRCPQTTTALGQKDLDRTRDLLRLAHSLGSYIDRFSIIALNSLNKIHDALTPEEMLRVECVPQNKEAGPRYLKSNAGRARRFAVKKGNELVPEEMSSTIACVSGFLFNMVERTVKLITPCNASQRWPLGYWVVDQGTFDSAGQLRAELERIISAHCRIHLGVDDVVRLRPDLAVDADADQLKVKSLGSTMTFSTLADAGELARLLTAGTLTVHDITTARFTSAGVDRAETVALLDSMFARGLFDEEPEPPAASGVAAPRPLTLSAR